MHKGVARTNEKGLHSTAATLLKVAWTSGQGEEDQMSGRCVDEVQAADLTDLRQEARQIVRLEGVDQHHSALLAKMMVTEGHHSTRYVGLAEWNGVEKTGSPAVKEDVAVADVRPEVGVEDSCFAQQGRMCLREESFPEDFERVSLRLKPP
jgi:hypothetical protein